MIESSGTSKSGEKASGEQEKAKGNEKEITQKSGVEKNKGNREQVHSQGGQGKIRGQESRQTGAMKRKNEGTSGNRRGGIYSGRGGGRPGWEKTQSVRKSSEPVRMAIHRFQHRESIAREGSSGSPQVAE